MTTTATTVTVPTVKIAPVCDDCLMVAYDAGIDDPSEQARVMRDAGEVLSDHLCSAKEEPEYFPGGCSCGCYGR